MNMSAQLLQMYLANFLSNVSDGVCRALWQAWVLFLAAFHDKIKDAVPEIVQLIKSDDYNVQSAARDALGKLIEQGK